MVFGQTRSLKEKHSVLVEFPTEWVTSSIPSEAQQSARYFAQMVAAASDLGLNVETVSSVMYSDASPRLARRGQCCISYHSFGDEPHVWRVKESYLPGFYTFDRFGYSGFSELARNPQGFRAAIEAFDLAEADQIIAACKARFFDANLSKYAQPDTVSEELPADYVFFPLQTVHDRVQRFARVVQVDAIKALAMASERAGLPLVIKRHPYCHDETTRQVLDEIRTNHALVHVVNGPIRDLVAGASAVVGANSGVLFEALLAGKPVFSFASSDFEQACITLADSDAFDVVFQQTHSIKPEFPRRFLGWYLDQYCLCLDRPQSFAEKLRLAISEIKPKHHFSAWLQDQTIRFNTARQQVKQAYAHIEKERRLNASTSLSSLELNMVRDAYNIRAKTLLNQLEQRAPDFATLPVVPKLAIARERHSQEAYFAQENNLRDLLPQLAKTSARHVIALGTQDRVFFERAAICFDHVTGLMLTEEGTLPQDYGNTRFRRLDLQQEPLPKADLCCSFDVLQRFSPEALDPLLDRLLAADMQHIHVIPCYDPSHSGRAVLDMGAWLALFQRRRPEAWIFDINTRFNDSTRLACCITTLPIHVLL